MKSKSLSPYCTRYFRVLYVPVIFSSKSTPHSPSRSFDDLELALELEHAVVAPLGREPERRRDHEVVGRGPRRLDPDLVELAARAPSTSSACRPCPASGGVKLASCPTTASKSMSGLSERAVTRMEKRSESLSATTKSRTSSASPDATVTVTFALIVRRLLSGAARRAWSGRGGRSAVVRRGVRAEVALALAAVELEVEHRRPGAGDGRRRR